MLPLAHILPPGARGSGRPDVVLVLGLLECLYAAGWWRLGRRAGGRADVRRLASFTGGVALVALALVSPLDALVDRSFAAHMTQHILIMMLAPPLLLLGDPLARTLWALPRDVRVGLGALVGPRAWPRRIWRRLSSPPAAGLTSALLLWLWHVPAAYDLALRSEGIHDVEHLALFWAGMLFWWPIVSPAPRERSRPAFPSRIAYLILVGGQQALLGLLISMSPRLLYPFYAGGPGPWGLAPLEDQMLGGLIMWGSTTVVGLVTLMALFYRFLLTEERRGALAEPGLAQSHLP